MGIHGLLPFLKNASREVDIKNFSGSTVAIDAYCWLHKGAFSCADQLSRGEPTDGYVQYCMKMINMLLAAGVKPVLVFDGRNLPSKSVTETKRRENREKCQKMARQFLREGNVKEARLCFQKAIDITPEMAHKVILACRKKRIDCIVAPYEADAQLAYLAKCGIAQIVITEDSDLVVFGCERVIFKMDIGGRGIMVEKSELARCLRSRAENFTFEKFRYTCILSGCDYLPSLPGIGLAKSCKFFNLITNPDVFKALGKLPSYLKMPNLVVSTEYKEGFVRANNTILYQLVFCPLTKKMVPLHSYPADVHPKDMPYAGSYLPEDLALQFAMGNVHLHTLEPFPDERRCKDTWELSDSKENQNSIWDKNYKISRKATPEKNTSSLHRTKGEIAVVRTEDIFKEISSPQKRERYSSLTEEEIEAKLTNSYTSQNSKKTKSGSSPLKSPASRNTTFVDSLQTKSSPSVVRSRFFVDSSNERTCVTPAANSSWLDEIESEYKMESIFPTRNIDTNGTSPFQTLDKKIAKMNSPATTHLKSKFSSEAAPKEDRQSVNNSGSQEINEVQPKMQGASKFSWSKSLLASSFEDKNNKLQNSPSCKLKFKAVIPNSCYFASIKEFQSPTMDETLLSQYSGCSIDDDSFSQKSSCCARDLNGDSTDGRGSDSRLCSETDEIVQEASAQLGGALNTMNITDENVTNAELTKPKVPIENERFVGSRCSGLRKRFTQTLLKDMIDKFSFERTPRTAGRQASNGTSQWTIV